ncbi:hypothetical protein GP486_001485 [Trichoglossum hirsutum]|uniref:JmjC domain-containing protein n=1 Tax=Trichoglossum hirsutum TaxID=265104 RepID=A0A9P8LGK6_9PEZI|nr:hypothetical protein GP486_001485 [Trichoglossum hirsutum]
MDSRSDEHRAAFNAYLRENGTRSFKKDTWNLYVEYLRDGVDPAPKAGSNIPANKYSINKRYYWGGNELIYKAGDKITIREDRIFDTLAFEYARSSCSGRLNFWKDIQKKYHGITMNDAYRFIDDYRKFHTGTPDINDANGEDGTISTGRPVVGEDTDRQLESEGIYHYEGGSEGGSTPGYNPPTVFQETQRWIEWLRQMKDRAWPMSIENSRYRDIVSGLYIILEAARPAATYFEGIGGQAEYGSVPYDSADVLCLTMQQATAELEKSEGAAKPMLIKYDPTTSKSLKTLSYCLDFMRDYAAILKSVVVQDPSRRRDQTSETTWPVDKVVSRFTTGSEPPEQQPPINLLLDCLETNPVPECFTTDTMNYLPKLRVVTHGGPTEDLKPSWNRVEKWRFLAQGGSGSMTHCDNCGFWTWIKVDEGKTLWLLCQLSEDDWGDFASQGIGFTGGQWSYVWLEPGDVLVMPPSTVHAAFTPVDTLCIGGNAWSQKRMGDTMRSIVFETTRPIVTDEVVTQLSELLEKTWQRMLIAPDEGYTADFGGEGQIDLFGHYYKVCRFLPYNARF